MATTVLDLSNEVLTKIAKHLGNNQKSILSLSLACRRIFPLARDILYGHIDLRKEQIPPQSLYQLPSFFHDPPPLWIGRHRMKCFHKNSSMRARLKSLLRAWEKSPVLMFQTLKSFGFEFVELCRDAQCAGRYRDLQIRLITVLADAKNLRSLTMQIPNDKIDILTSAFQDHTRNPFPVLQRLEVQQEFIHTNFSTCLSLILCAHPSLRHIRIDSTEWAGSGRAQLPTTPARKSAISSLVMTGSLRSDEILRLALSSMPNLESLGIWIPEGHLVTHFNTDPETRYEVAILKPGGLTQHISLVRHTLRSLKIISPREIVWQHDRSQMDFSSFSCLEELQVSSVLLLSDILSMSSAPDINVPVLLPPSLRNLAICFDTLQGIFHSNEDMRTVTPHWFQAHDPPLDSRDWPTLWSEGPGKPSTIIENFSWLHDLSDTCRNLEQLTLEENHARHKYVESGYFSSIDVVPYHATFFENFKFKCSISIYVDTRWWKFVKRCRCWNLVDENPKMLPWIKLDDLRLSGSSVEWKQWDNSWRHPSYIARRSRLRISRA